MIGRTPNLGERDTVSQTFQVDLRGVVDLLSSPSVRQSSGLPAGTAAERGRRDHRPSRIDGDDAPALVRVEPPEVTGDGTLRVHDTGPIGHDRAQVHVLLATIGRSSQTGRT